MNWLLIIGVVLVSLGVLYFFSTRSPVVQSKFLSQAHLAEIFTIIQSLRQTEFTAQTTPQRTSQGIFISYMRNYTSDNAFFIHNILFGVDSKTNPKDWNTLVHQHLSSFVRNAYKLEHPPKTNITETGVLFVTILFRSQTENTAFIEKDITTPEDHFLLTQPYGDITIEQYTQMPSATSATNTTDTTSAT